MKKPLTALESATLATIVDTQHEHDGWVDLARVSSRTARHLSDVRQAVARLSRYGLINVEGSSADDERWLKITLPEGAEQ